MQRKASLHARVVETSGRVRAAIVGTGYIADFHARGIKHAPGVDLIAVCDVNATAAQAFAADRGVSAYESLERMLAEQRIDVLHVLVPPDLHYRLAKAALKAGTNVLLEKPMCATASDADELLAIAAAKGLTVGVNHSMLFEGAFLRLRRHVHSGDLGPLENLTINYFNELPLIRSGPFDNWMLREPGNALLEVGPHPISGLLDLVGVPEQLEVVADRDVTLPGGGLAYRRWRVRAQGARFAAQLNIDLAPGFPQRTIAVRGLLGTALADLDANTCTVDRRMPASPDFERYSRSKSQATQLQQQARTTLADYILSKAKIGKRGNPYQSSIQNSIESFYAGFRSPAGLDSRMTGEFGRAVIETCETIIRKAELKVHAAHPRLKPANDLKPTVLVLGGTGFIGQRLIKQLLEKGYVVRAAARGASAKLETLGSDRLQIVRADMRSHSDLAHILDGIQIVFHLATSSAKTWDQFMKREVEPARALARACQEHGIKRLIYTGTIDSFYAGRGAGTITEGTPLDPGIKRRNYYARAKAAVEGLLLEMHLE